MLITITFTLYEKCVTLINMKKAQYVSQVSFTMRRQWEQKVNFSIIHSHHEKGSYTKFWQQQRHVKMGIIATTDGGAYDGNRKQEIGIICHHSVNELKYV